LPIYKEARKAGIRKCRNSEIRKPGKQEKKSRNNGMMEC